MTGADASRTLAIVADSLTFVRATIAITLIPVLGTGRIVLAAGLVGVAWLSDFFDGRAARASHMPTTLGGWDLDADTAVGAGIVLGFTFSGWLNPWLGLGIVMVCGFAFVVTHNEAMSMLLQALGYGLLTWRTHSDGHPVALAWLVSVVAVIGLINRRVFWERSVPTFLGGLGLPSGRGRSE